VTTDGPGQATSPGWIGRLRARLPGSRHRRPSHVASAVVTGAGSGIGRAFARVIAARGGRVVCADIENDAAEVTAESICAEGGAAMAVHCDVADAEQVMALAARAEAWLDGPVDLVINNAGVGLGGRVGELPLADWQWALGVNLWGVIHGCHVFVPSLRRQGRGGVINVASAAGFAAAPEMAAYNVGKSGVMALSETLAAELAGTGVRISVLCPTFVQTEIARRARVANETHRKAAERLMRWTGYSADRVAAMTLDAFDRGQLYVLPQIDARLVWRLKRALPAGYARGLGWLYRTGFGGDRKQDGGERDAIGS